MAIARVVADLAISTDALSGLVANGPEATNLLYERMRALGISKGDVDKAAQGVMRDFRAAMPAFLLRSTAPAY